MRKYLLFPGTYRTKVDRKVYHTMSSHAGSMLQQYNLDPKECIVIPNRHTAEECGYNSKDYICIVATPHNTKLPTKKGMPKDLIAEWHSS